MVAQVLMVNLDWLQFVTKKYVGHLGAEDSMDGRMFLFLGMVAGVKSNKL